MSPINLLQNRALTPAETRGQTATVGEPTAANNDREIFLAGNWYATKTVDGGTTWAAVNPDTSFPADAGGFCCDQVVAYDPANNLLFWLLQYARDAKRGNLLRLAVKRGGTLGDNTWYWWDFRPETTNPAWAGTWFDYPDLELGDSFLYLTTNNFSGETFVRSVVFRLPLQTLADRGHLSYRYFASTQSFSLRCVRGARDTMYFASHGAGSQVRVFSWPEAAPSPSVHDVNVSVWNAGLYSAPGPDGTNWLARCDERITGAWIANGTIGLAWTANRRGPRPFPHVRVVEIDAASMLATADRDIWSRNYAYAYPNGAANDAGKIGITLFRGGAQINPGHVVGAFDETSGSWQLMATRNGTNGPTDNKWGDYLTCRRHAPDGQTWLATGYTLQGGGQPTNVEPRLVRFSA